MGLFKNNHANQRYFERVHPDIASKKDIVKAIQHPNNIEYIKKLTESRSMAYVHLPNNNVVKIIINKRKKELVTILPWQDVYRIEVIHNGFIILLYPDCYLETKNASTLNKVRVYSTESENYEDVPFSSLLFETAIHKAWLIHTEAKQNENKTEEETTESIPEEK